MARNRTPKRKAAVSGAILRNPSRYRGGLPLNATRPLGDPYPTMSEAEVVVWHEMKANMPWLHSSHRIIVRLACVLQVRLEEGRLGLTGIRSLLSVLSKLGATPVDEGNISPPEDPGDDGFDWEARH